MHPSQIQFRGHLFCDSLLFRAEMNTPFSLEVPWSASTSVHSATGLSTFLLALLDLTTVIADKMRVVVVVVVACVTDMKDMINNEAWMCSGCGASALMCREARLWLEGGKGKWMRLSSLASKDGIQALERDSRAKSKNCWGAWVA